MSKDAGTGLIVAIVAIIIILAISCPIFNHLDKDELPPPGEYGFYINTIDGNYIANEIAFYEGYLVLEDYYKVSIFGRGDHHTNTLLLSGDKITITSRGED